MVLLQRESRPSEPFTPVGLLFLCSARTHLLCVPPLLCASLAPASTRTSPSASLTRPPSVVTVQSKSTLLAANDRWPFVHSRLKAGCLQPPSSGGSRISSILSLPSPISIGVRSILVNIVLEDARHFEFLGVVMGVSHVLTSHRSRWVSARGP